jgi:hypothetical protein
MSTTRRVFPEVFKREANHRHGGAAIQGRQARDEVDAAGGGALVADRPVAGAAHARMEGQRHQMQQATTAEVRLDAVGAAQLRAAVRSTSGFEHLMRAASAVAHCSSR